MPLVLTLHKARSPSDRQRESRTLDRGKLSIGRGPANDWVLQDPEQHLSKTHCIVSFEGGRYVVTDVSSNGIYMNGSPQRVPRDGKAALVDGDEFLMGDFLVRVSEVEALSSRAVTDSAASPSRGVPAAASYADDPFGLDDFLAPAPAPVPLPDLEPPRPMPQARFDPFEADSHGRDDPFGDPLEEPLLAPQAPVARAFGEAAPKPPMRPRDPFDEPKSASATARESGRDAFGDADDLFMRQDPRGELVRTLAAGQRGCRGPGVDRAEGDCRCPTWTIGTTCWATPRRGFRKARPCLRWRSSPPVPPRRCHPRRHPPPSRRHRQPPPLFPRPLPRLTLLPGRGCWRHSWTGRGWRGWT